MVGDGCLDFPSESGLNDEIPAYITEVAADNRREILYEDGTELLTCYMRVPYTGGSSVSTTEDKFNIHSLTVMW